MRHGKTIRIAVLAAVFAGLAAGVALAAGSLTVKSAHNAKLGKTVLVDSHGRTLYRNTTEKNGKIKCTGSCALDWPPLLVPAGEKAVAGTGVTAAKLGKVKRPDGKTQVTYAGSPLYRFAADHKAGDANGQGIDGIWFAVTPAPSKPASMPPALPPASTDSGSGYGSGGYGG
jgi:predicted lipoprotein with Yx(FWY)xxD motif